MRRALAERDIGLVYRRLRRIGYSQVRLGALNIQSQPEVSAIMHGRQVIALTVLARIAEGLGIPLAYMGFACCPCKHSTPFPVDRSPADEAPAGRLCVL